MMASNASICCSRGHKQSILLCNLEDLLGKDNSSKENCHLLKLGSYLNHFVIISSSYNDTVVTKVLAEIWEHCHNKVRQGKK